MQTTRQKILQYLDKNRQATAVELSQVLDLTQANIRHHLSVLEKEGKVEIIGETPPQGRGRPTLIYMAARSEQASALDVLASILLQQSQEGAPPNKQREYLSEVASKMAGKTGKQGSITIRLSSATQYLNAYHYKAHWEAHADAPHIFLNHCPFAEIITQHPELCEMDKYLLEHLTNEKVEQVDKQSRTPQGPGYCRFVIK